jgi:colicin import membrane protein
MHAMAIAALLYVRIDYPPPRLPPGAISVNLVSLPGPGPAPGPVAGDAGPAAVEAPKPAAEKPVVSVAEPKPVPMAPPKPEVSTAPPIIKEKKSLKEATKDSHKMIERAIERIEKKVSEPNTSSVASAIERLKKKFGEAESTPPRPGPPGATAGQGGGGGGGGGGGPGPIEPIDIYRATVASQVERNWAFSAQLAGSDKNLRVGLVFKVLPNGEITDIRYTERSNNSYLDDSAYRAIVKSSPVVPHPAVIKAPYVTVAIRFTPEGMR